jgi:hypothetical protein
MQLEIFVKLTIIVKKASDAFLYSFWIGYSGCALLDLRAIAGLFNGGCMGIGGVGGIGKLAT